MKIVFTPHAYISLAMIFSTILPIQSSHTNTILTEQGEKLQFRFDDTTQLTYSSKGRHYPILPNNNDDLIDIIIYLENLFSKDIAFVHDLPRLAHYQQVIYRVLSKDSRRTSFVLSKLPERYRRIASLHIQARKSFLLMEKKYGKPSLMPAWEIVPPEPIHLLLSYYYQAEQATGIDWEILAAINLVETGMGRIKGQSIANAQGPMQFLPSTWSEPGIGNNGDINDPNDSIQAAARYLVRRGGLLDIKKALWGYNNNDEYVNAVLLYSEILKENPLAYRSLFHWEIHFSVEEADLWLPVGYSQKIKIPISTYLTDFPESSPPE